MVVIRPVTLDDLDALVALAEQASYGLTTLPRDPELLRARVEGSMRGFEKLKQKPEGEPYLFVMEDLTTGHIVGTTGINSKVGGFEPFYAYRIETSVHESKSLKVRKEVNVLHLYREHDGPTEIGTLFLAKPYRGGGNGRLLSLCRFLFMAEFKKFFDKSVIAEMRGVIDDEGRSPFWDAVGLHFFDTDLATADYLSVKNKAFIADLMPQHPVYIPLLPAEAQAVIGKVHPATEPALKMLLDEGFALTDLVDIFEAGPVVSCKLTRIRSVKQSKRGQVAAIVDGPIESADFLISNALRDFRACTGPLTEHDDGSVTIDKVTALGLKLKVGAKVRYVAVRPQVKEDQAKATKKKVRKRKAKKG